MSELTSCGVLLYRNTPPPLSFLLLRHPTRWDLPKGHVDPGETELQCALREMEEETGFARDDVRLHTDFRFVQEYEVRYKRTGYKPMQKSLVIFLGELLNDAPIVLTEHEDCQWFSWSPPHQIQEQTIDPLLSQVESYFGSADL